jgi:hypothetical protein
MSAPKRARPFAARLAIGSTGLCWRQDFGQPPTRQGRIPRATSKDQKRKSLGNHRKNALLLYLPRILACEASYDPCAEQPKHKSD